MMSIFLVLLLGCGGNSGPADGGKEVLAPLHALETADEALWARSIWWIAQPGETVDGIIFRETPDGRHPVIAIESAGPRRTLALRSPADHESLAHHIKPDQSDSKSVTVPSAGKRILITEVDGFTRMRAVEMHGKGTSDLLLDPTTPNLVHPTVNADANALYVDELGAGLFRFQLDGGPPTRIARHATRPLSWPAGEERLVAVDRPPGEPEQVVVFYPAPTNIQPASSVLSDLPPNLYALSEVHDSWYAFQGCDGIVSLDTSLKGDAVDILGVTATDAVVDGCGEGCTVLYERADDTLVEIGQVTRQDATWSFQFSPHTGAAAGGTWAGEDALAGATSIKSCVEPANEAQWVQTYRHFGGPKEAWLGIEGNHQRVQLGGTRNKGKQPVVATVPHDDRGLLTRNTSKFKTYDNTRVERAGDDALIEAAKGGITWTTRSNGDASTLMPASDERTLDAIAVSDDMSVMAYADSGNKPGVYRITLNDSQVAQIAPATTAKAMAVYTRNGHEEISWVTTEEQLPALLAARPWSQELLEAWNSGPRTLVGLGRSWSAIQRKDGEWTRCNGPLEVTLDVGAEGGPTLTRDKTTLRVHAAIEEGSDIHLLGSGEDGVVRIVASMLREATGPADTWSWRFRRPNQPMTAASWVASEDAEALELKGPCRKF